MSTQAKTRTRSQRSTTPSGGNNSKQSTSAVQSVNLNGTTRKSIPPCENSSKQCNLSNSKCDIDTEVSLNDHLSSLHGKFNEVRKQIEVQNQSLECRLNEFSVKLSLIDKLVAENTLLKERVTKLEQKIDKMGINSRGSEISEMDSIANEIDERNRRKRNIIVCNVEENSHSKLDDVIREDKSRICTLLGTIDPSVTASDLKCFRLGRRNNNKPRPIKVILKHENQVIEIMKNRFKLSAPIRVYRDQTVIQRNKYMKLKDELKIRGQNGEKDLIIKFIKGIPRIINTNSKNSSCIIKTSGA